MKIFNINKISLSGIAIMLLVIVAISCKKEETYGPWDTGTLDATIAVAEDLIANNQDGLNPGEYKPGSIKELRDATDWAIWKKDNSKKQDEIESANRRLNKYIERFHNNIITLSNPWIHQDPGTWIELSDNTAGEGTAGQVNEITKQPFTIEAKFYIIDLAQRGYSNNMFSKVMGLGGPNDRGFGIRYFSDGNIHLNVGGDGWNHVEAGAGTVTDGKWIHVTYVNDVNHHELYIDGQLVIENDNLYVAADDDYPMVIGNTPPWDDRIVNAMVKDFRFWNKVRTAQEISDNIDATLTGEEDGLEILLPFNADLGGEFPDVTGKYKATFVGNVTWVEGGIPPVVELDYTLIDQAIADATALKAEVEPAEGTNDGDYPVGTANYIQALIDDANNTKTNAKRQDELDGKADDVQSKLSLVKTTLVEDADGVYIDRNDPNAVGLRITPNYTPQGNYTVEFEVNVTTLEGYGTGEFFNNGEFGIWVYGYTEPTEEAIFSSGGMRNFTSGPNGWEMGPTAPPLTIIPGNWQHVAVTHDEDVGGHPITIMYVDGVETGRDTIAVPNVSGWGEIWLGNGWGKMHGSIKNFRMWDEARTELNADITGTETNLKIYFPLDRVAGVGFKDATGNFDGEMRGIKWNTSQ